MNQLKLLIIFSLFCGLSASLIADDSTDFNESEILYVRRIAPLIREKCLACHGGSPDEIEGGFDVRSLQSMLIGGDSEDPGIVVGKPDQSSLYLAAARGEVTFSAMPPKEAEKLTDTQLQWLHQWISTGAKWPSAERQKAINKNMNPPGLPRMVWPSKPLEDFPPIGLIGNMILPVYGLTHLYRRSN